MAKNTKTTQEMDEHKVQKKKKKRRGTGILVLLFLIALGVFGYSAWKLLSAELSYKQGTDEYDGLSEIFEEAALPEAVIDEATGQEVMTIQGDTEGPWVYFYETMKAKNSDYVGWIRIKDTNIDYPIVQYSDNDYYLKHTFLGQSNAAGTLFIDCGIEAGMEGKNVVVYGHNMKNKSMFADLKKFRDKDFYEAHRTFRVYTQTGFYTYEIFTIYETDPDSDTYSIGFPTDDDFYQYCLKMQSQSIYDTGVSIAKEDQIITLSTCVNDLTDRLVVQAKRLK